MRTENELYRSENENHREENERYRGENEIHKEENLRYKSENEIHREENVRLEATVTQLNRTVAVVSGVQTALQKGLQDVTGPKLAEQLAKKVETALKDEEVLKSWVLPLETLRTDYEKTASEYEKTLEKLTCLECRMEK